MPTAEAGEPAWVLQVNRGRSVMDVFAADGSGRYSPTEAIAGGGQTNPDWSPDGEQLTFTMTDAGRDDLWIVNVDGTGARRLADCEDPCDWYDDPAWSPDGRTIAACKFEARDGGHYGTLVGVDVASGQESVLFTPEGTKFCAGARWSPDGGSVVFELVDREGPEIDSAVSGVTLTIADLTTNPPTLTPLTDPALFAVTPDWSRDSGLIVYSGLVAAGDDLPELFIIDPDEGSPHRLTFVSDDGGFAAEPSFDSVGETIVFVGEGGLFRVDVAGGDVSPAFAERISGTHPRSRP